MKIQSLCKQYAAVSLKKDISILTENERKMISLLIEAAQVMEEIFWVQAYGEKETLLASIEDPLIRRYVQMNFGPWDRLRNNQPFINGAGSKPLGANFYPSDMTKTEFEAAATISPELKGQYSMVLRKDNEQLVAIPYHVFFQSQVRLASNKLKEAANLSDDENLKRFLTMRSEALLTDNYQLSNIAWMDMKENTIDIVIGPIETYEDQLFGYKSSYEAFIMVKDWQATKNLDRYVDLLSHLQQNLPMPNSYKLEGAGSSSDLNVYDLIYCSGEANSGAKFIALNLPNDEDVQVAKGSRRLYFKNVMNAKFNKILLPFANKIIAKDQRIHITNYAFFYNIIFHEVSHGLGIKHTITNKLAVHTSLKDIDSPIEECKADILSLYLLEKLSEWGELIEVNLLDNYVTFFTSILRSIRPRNV